MKNAVFGIWRRSSEDVGLYETHISEDGILRRYRRENLKSYMRYWYVRDLIRNLKRGHIYMEY
jgi:hypothetical protein